MVWTVLLSEPQLMKHSPLFKCSALLWSLANLILSSDLRADDGTWIDLSPGPNLWSNPLMWNGGNIADGSGFTANFGSDITAATTVTLDSSRNLTNLTFSDAGTSGSTWLLNATGGSVLTLGNGTTTGISTLNTLTGTTISAALGGANSILKTGTASLTLSGTNTFSGGILISQGSLTLGSTTAAGSGTITLGDTNTGAENISLFFAPTANAQSINNSLVVSAQGTGTVTIGTATTNLTNQSFSGSVVLNRATTLQTGTTGDRTNFSGVISGNVGTLTISGGTRMVFTGSSKTFLGDISITGAGTALQIGVITATATDQIPNTSNVNLGSGTLLRLSSLSEEFGGLNGSGTLNSNSAPSGGVFIIGSQNKNGNFSGVIGSGGVGLGITKIGTGTQTLSGSGTYTGATTINGGTLTLAFGTVTSNILGSSSALTLGGGTLSLTGTGTQTVNGLTTTANTSSRIVLGANQTLTLGGLTSAGTGSSLNFDTMLGGANGATIGTGIITLTGQTAGASIRPGFTVTDAGGTGFATVNASNQIIRLISSTLLPASGAMSTTDYLIDNNNGGATAAGSSTLTLTASAAARTLQVSDGTTNGVLTLNSGVVLSNNGWAFTGVGTGTYQITGGSGLTSVAAGDSIVFNNYHGGRVTLNSPILANGTNAVSFNGTGTTTIGAVSTYTGTTAVNGGTLELNVGGSTGAIRGSLVIAPNATVSLTTAGALGTAQGTRVGNITLNSGTLNIANTGNNAITTGTITMNGGTMSGITGSKFDLRNNGAGNSNITTTASSVTSVISVGTLGLPFNEATLTVAAGSTSSGIDLLISSNIVNDAGTGGSSSSGSSVSSINKAGLGTLRLSGTNTFTGDTNLNAGTLNLANQSALGNSSLNLNGGTLVFDSSVTGNAFTFGGLKGTGNLALVNNATTPVGIALTIGGNNADILYPGILSGSGSLIKNGTGVLNLTGINTFTGGVRLDRGTLRINSEANLGTNSTIIANASVSNTTITSADANPLTLTRSISMNIASGGVTFGDAVGSGDLTFTGNLTRASGSSNRTVSVFGTTSVTFNGNLLTPGANATTAFSKTGTGTLTIRGTGDSNDPGYSNVIVNAGVLAVTRLANLGTASSLGRGSTATTGAVSITLDGGTLLYVDGGGAASSTNRQLQIGTTTDGAIGIIRNNATVTTETVSFTNTSSLAYGTTGQARTLILGGTNTGANTFAPVIADNGTGLVSLTKEGLGTWRLTSANTFTGQTIVSGGTLELAVGGNAGAIRSTLTVQEGATVNVTSANGLGLSTGTRVGNITLDRGTLNIQNTGNNALTSAVLTLNGATLTGITGSNFDLRNNGSGNTTVDVLASSTTSVISVTNLGMAGNDTIFNVAQGTTPTGVDLLINSVIVANAGAGGGSSNHSFTKTGEGRMRLTGISTYTGTTTVNAGVLELAVGGGAGAIRSNLVINTGATTVLSAANALGNVQNTRVTNITLNGGTLDIQNTGNNSLTTGALTFIGGVITGISGSNFDLRNNGAGSSTVTTSSASTTALIGVTTLGMPANVTNFNIATGATPSGIDLWISSNIVNNAGTGSSQSNANALIKNGSGSLRLSGNNTYTGETVMNEGVLRLGSSTAIGSSTLNFLGGSIVFENSVASNSFTFGGLKGTNSLTLANSDSVAIALTVGGNNESTLYSGNLSGAGSLIKSGTGVLTLTGTNTYEGTTTVNGNGTVLFANVFSLYNNLTDRWNATQLTANSGGTLGFRVGGTDEFTANDVTLLLSQLNGVVNNNGLRSGSFIGFDTTNASGGIFTLSNVIANTTGTGGGTVGLTKFGTGTLRLTSIQTYTGATTVNGGILDLNIGGGTGAIRSSLTVNSGASVVVSAANGLGNTQNNRVTGITLNGSTLDFQNTGNNSLTSGVLTMTGATVTGTTNSNFDLRNHGAGSTNIVTNASAVTSVINVTRLGLPGNSASITVASGTTPSQIDLHISSNIINNAGTGGSGAGTNSITKLGAGRLLLSGTNTFTGETLVNAGSILLGNTLALGSSPVNLNGGSVLFDSTVTSKEFTFGHLRGVGNLTLSNNAATPEAISLSVGGALGDATYSGILSGLGAITKTGTGTLTLAGSNTYSGTTTLMAGTLALASTGRTGTGSVIISTGTTILGTGLVQGSTFTAQSGSFVHAGNGRTQSDYGTLSFSAPSSGGSFHFQSSSNTILGLNPGGIGDVLSFNGFSNGNLIFDGNLQITAPGYVPVSPETFNLLDWSNLSTTQFNNRYLSSSYDGLIFGNSDDGFGFDLPDISASGYGWDISQFVINGSISVVLVPEPSRALFCALGLLSLLSRRRRVSAR